MSIRSLCHVTTTKEYWGWELSETEWLVKLSYNGASGDFDLSKEVTTQIRYLFLIFTTDLREDRTRVFPFDSCHSVAV